MTVEDLLDKLDMDVYCYYIYKGDNIDNRLYYSEEALFSYNESKVKLFWIVDNGLEEGVDLYIELEEKNQ